VTPQERHAGGDAAILALRTRVYLAAAQKCPERWRGRATRNWMPVGGVWLNPDKPNHQGRKGLPFAA